MTQSNIPRSRPSRPYWVLVVLICYLLILAGVTILPWIVLGSNDGAQIAAIFTAIWLFLLAGLMFVPIQVRRQRPLSRKTIWIPLLFTGLLAGVAAFAAGMALWELYNKELAGFDLLLPLSAGAVGVWALWAGIFYLLTRRWGRTPIALTLHHWLFAGTIAELVVAVSCHIIVRRRTECCAGIMTATAILTGVLILVLALGPGVVLLYLKRWRQLRPPLDALHGFEVTVTPAAKPSPNGTPTDANL